MFPDITELIQIFVEKNIEILDDIIASTYKEDIPARYYNSIKNSEFQIYFNDQLLLKRKGLLIYTKHHLHLILIDPTTKSADKITALKQLNEITLESDFTSTDLEKLFRSKIIALLNSNNKKDSTEALKMILNASEKYTFTSALIDSIKDIISGKGA